MSVPAPKQNPPVPTSSSGGTLDAIAIVQTADASAPNAQAIDATITPSALIKAKSDGSGELVDAVAGTDYAAPGEPATQLDANGTVLDVNVINDGEFLKRVGTTVVSAVPTAVVDEAADYDWTGDHSYTNPILGLVPYVPGGVTALKLVGAPTIVGQGHVNINPGNSAPVDSQMSLFGGVDPDDVASSNYLDFYLEGATGNSVISIGAGTLSIGNDTLAVNPIVMNADGTLALTGLVAPVSPTDAVTKAFAEGLASSAVPDSADNIAYATYEHRQLIKGVSANGVATESWEFMNDGTVDHAEGWFTAVGAAPTYGLYVGGILQIATTAAGGDAAGQYVEKPPAFNVPPNSVGERAWALSYRAKVTGLLEAGTQAYVGLGQTPEALTWIGIHCTGSLTKYVAQPLYTVTPAVVLSSDQNIDQANYVQLDLYYDKTNLFARVNGGPWRNIAVAADVYNSYGYLTWYLKNGATASIRTMALDFVVFSVERQ